MSERIRHITIDDTATMAQLAEEARETGRTLRVRLDDVFVTAVPADQAIKRQPRRKARTSIAGAEKYPTVASLGGVAGSLPAPHPWDEVRESARDEHLAAKFGPPRS